MNWLNEFARQNTFLSLIILAIVGNFAYDIFKKLMFFILTKVSSQTSKTAQKNIKYFVNHYTEEIERVEKIKLSDPSELYELLESLYNNVILIIFMLISYLITVRINDGYWFYSFLLVSSSMMFRLIANTIYNHGLMLKAKRFDSYKQKMLNKISRLNKLIKE